MERTRNRELTRGGGSAVAAIALAFLCARCGAFRGEAPSFGALLAKIDADPVSATPAAYVNAAALAQGTEDRLRILKRASARDPAVYADSARAIIAAGAVSEPVAVAVLDAYLEAGRYEDALTLFDGPLSPSLRPLEYAETLVLAVRNGYAPPRPSTDRLVRCADAACDARFLEAAAVDAMLEGDRPRARALLVDVAGFGASVDRRVPYRLLWDAAALETLCDRIPDPHDPLEIAVCGDAEYLSGAIASACVAYADLVERFPSWSWKPYAALARVRGVEREDGPSEWPHVDVTAPTDVPERLIAAMVGRFPDSTEAALERARWLASVGRPERAASELAALRGEAAAIIALRYGPPTRALPDASRLAAEYPDSAAAVDEALAALARSGAWPRFSEIAARADAAGLETARSWFWRAVLSSLSGDPGAAAEAISNYGIESAGYPGAFDLGILESASSRPGKAAAAFVLAAGLADSPERRADAYVMAGDALRDDGRGDDARSAYEAALSAFPASREARSRLGRLKMDD